MNPVMHPQRFPVCPTESLLHFAQAVELPVRRTGHQMGLISFMGATAPLGRGGDVSARVRWATVFFHSRCSCKHASLPTPWPTRTIWDKEREREREKKLDAKKNAQKRKEFKKLWQTGPVLHFCRRSGDEMDHAKGEVH